MRNSMAIKERIGMFKKYLCRKYRPSNFSNREANQYAVAAMLEKLPDWSLTVFTIVFAWKFIGDGWSTKYIRDDVRRRMEEYLEEKNGEEHGR